MSVALLMACFATERSASFSVIRNSGTVSFAGSKVLPKRVGRNQHLDKHQIQRFMSNTSSQSEPKATYKGIPRLEILQILASTYGVPGSLRCTAGNGDLVATSQYRETLHPYLIPIFQSQSTGNFICALTHVGGSDNEMCPIVESGDFFPGMKLLALNR